MIRKCLRTITYLALGLLIPIGSVLEVEAQRRAGGSRGGGGRSAHSSSNVNRGGSARSGSTHRSASSTPSSSNRSARPSNQTRASNQPRAGRGSPGRTTGRAGGRRTSTRRTSASRSGRRHRNRRVHRSRRWRRSPWRYHRYWHHRRWYGGFWVGRFILRAATWTAIANSSSSTTYVVYGTSYVHYNPWYRPVMYEGEEGHVLTAPPVGHKADALPDGGETVTFEGQTYTYADWGFWQPSGGGFVVVEPPVGAEVRTIPDDAVAHDDEGEGTLYQFDRSYFSKSTNDAGQTVYVVEPQPPAEEIDSIPAGSPSFEADGETFYYVDFNLYVAFDENGATGYVNGEPEIGAQTDALPEGTTEIEYDGVTYHQFDMVFFEQVEDENGNPFYEVVDAPGDDEVTELG